MPDNQKKELTAKDVATIIVDNILEERTISRDKLTPLIEALIKAFTIANNTMVVEKNQNARLLSSNKNDFKQLYWRRLAKTLLTPEEVEMHYKYLNDVESEMDFTEVRSHLAIPKGYKFEDFIKK